MKNKNNLVIYPLDSNYKLKDIESFSGFLCDTKFIKPDSGSRAHENKFIPGELFMRHLTFLGCSPSIGSDDENKAYNNYQIVIDASSAKPELITSPRMKSPVCEKCHKQEKDKLASDGIQINQHKVVWICPSCDTEIPVADINWRHKLAVATDFIVVQGVFEGEVAPSDELLNQLATESGINWSYCYC